MPAASSSWPVGVPVCASCCWAAAACAAELPGTRISDELLADDEFSGALLLVDDDDEHDSVHDGDRDGDGEGEGDVVLWVQLVWAGLP
jgi:hypothetical protein